MTLLPLPHVRGAAKKGYQSTVFKSRNVTPPRTEYELNHASECQTLSVIKSQTKRAFWKEILRRSNYTKVDTIESCKHTSQDASC